MLTIHETFEHLAARAVHEYPGIGTYALLHHLYPSLVGETAEEALALLLHRHCDGVRQDSDGTWHPED